mgnify:CR=1 FL=1
MKIKTIDNILSATLIAGVLTMVLGALERKENYAFIGAITMTTSAVPLIYIHNKYYK